ncbi:hypothetical protein; putative exported protein [Thiomonas arsenitoxydans]|uniref:Uncharacterized protein n=1 Tax=Thiomonas arsenitoxydans (strain DSM 22701 / CIP 110005 / 3As) TaxID=426114 RepID=D6CQ46_THIA3|nr:hypothetical protein; putative exported protein [Thiomonas arsenitoxydans]
MLGKLVGSHVLCALCFVLCALCFVLCALCLSLIANCFALMQKHKANFNRGAGLHTLFGCSSSVF